MCRKTLSIEIQAKCKKSAQGGRRGWRGRIRPRPGQQVECFKFLNFSLSKLKVY